MSSLDDRPAEAPGGAAAEAGTPKTPWPCVRCGAPVRLVPPSRPWGALALLTVAALSPVVAVPALVARAPTVVPMQAILVGGFVATVALLRFTRRRRWACDRCGHRGPARLRPSIAPRYGIAVPAFNARTSITAVVADLRAHAPTLPLVVIDDGSTDDTAALAQAALGDDAVLRTPHNLGKGAAIRTALAWAQRQGLTHLATVDADGQHLGSELSHLLKSSEAEPRAIVVGSRDLSAPEVTGTSRFGRTFSNFWLAVLGGVRLADSQSGMRVYPVLPTLSLGCRRSRYDFEVEVLTRAGRAGIPLRATPIAVHYPPPAERLSHFRGFVDNARISLTNIGFVASLPLWALGYPGRFSDEPAPATILRDWSGKSRGGALGHAIFFWLLRALGPAPGYLVLYFVAAYFIVASRDIIRASENFLAHVLGPPKSGWEKLARSYRHILTFAQCILDRAVGLALGPKPFRWTSEGEDHIIAHVKEGHGVIFLSAHMGNYELAGTCSGEEFDFPMSIVMVDVEDEAIKDVYRRAQGQHREPEIIATNKSEWPALAILKALRRGHAVALQGDRVIDDNWVWCDFFGRRAPFPTGAFQMAHAARVPIVLTVGLRLGMRHYRFIGEPPRRIELPRQGRDEALAAHAQWYASRLESYVRQYPYQWFNLFDFWKAPAAHSGKTKALPSNPPA